MIASHRIVVGGLAAAVLAGFALLAGREALSYPDPSKPAAKWEYKTSTVDAASLQPALDDLATEGWDVFSIERTGLVIEQAPDNKTRLVADNFQVTGRRPR